MITRACSLASHSRSRSTLAARGPSGMSSTSYRWNRGYVCFFLQTFQDYDLSYDFPFMMLGPLVPAVTGWWFSFRNYHPTSPLRYQLNWHPFTGWHNIGHDESKWPQKGAQKRDSMGIFPIYPLTTFYSPTENKWPKMSCIFGPKLHTGSTLERFQ